MKVIPLSPEYNPSLGSSVFLFRMAVIAGSSYTYVKVF